MSMTLEKLSEDFAEAVESASSMLPAVFSGKNQA
jgi:hypothetical protein